MKSSASEPGLRLADKELICPLECKFRFESVSCVIEFTMTIWRLLFIFYRIFCHFLQYLDIRDFPVIREGVFPES